MVFTSVRDLKARASEYIREAHRKGGVVVLSHGKPVAALTPLGEDTLEDYIIENSPRLRGLIEDSFREHKAGGRTGLDSFIRKTKREIKRRR